MNTKQNIRTINVNVWLYTIDLPSGANCFEHFTLVQPSCNKIPIDLWHFHSGHPFHQCL